MNSSSYDVPLKSSSSPIEGDWRSMLGLFIVIALVPLSSVAGVGGGALFVPVFQALVGFGIKESTALSQALITAGSLVSFIINLFETSPIHPSIPLIDWPLCSILTPMSLAGIGIGVLLNSILPSYVISAVLVVLLSLLLIQSSLKGRSMWKAENRARMLKKDLKAKESRHDQQVPNQGHANFTSMDSMEGVPEQYTAGPSFPSVVSVPPPRLKRKLAMSAAELSYESYEGGFSSERRDFLEQPSSPAFEAAPGEASSSSINLHNVSMMFRATSRRLEQPLLNNGDSNIASQGWTARRGKWMARFMTHLREDGHEGMGEIIRPNPLMNMPLEDLTILAGQNHESPPSSPQAASVHMQRAHSVDHLAAIKPDQDMLTQEERKAILLAPPGRRHVTKAQHVAKAQSHIVQLMPTVPEVTAHAEGGAIVEKRTNVLQPSSIAVVIESANKTVKKPSGSKIGWFGRLPKILVLIMVLTWCLYIGLLILKSLSVRCSTRYWVGFSLQLALMASISSAVAWYLDEEEKKSSSNDPSVKGEDATPGEKASSVILFQALAFTAGLLGGMVGLGGGVILAPMLLSLGIQAQVASVTTTTIVVLSSSAALINFAITGMLNAQYAVVFGASAAVASLMGTIYIGKYIKRTGRVSLVVISLTVVMLAGVIGIFVVGTMNVVIAVQKGNGNWGVTPLC